MGVHDVGSRHEGNQLSQGNGVDWCRRARDNDGVAAYVDSCVEPIPKVTALRAGHFDRIPVRIEKRDQIGLMTQQATRRSRGHKKDRSLLHILRLTLVPLVPARRQKVGSNDRNGPRRWRSTTQTFNSTLASTRFDAISVDSESGIRRVEKAELDGSNSKVSRD